MVRRPLFDFLMIVAVAVLMSMSSAVPASPQRAPVTDIIGGRGGSPFADPQTPNGARVAEVRIWSGDRVDSVQFVYLLPNGRTSAAPRHGGGGGRLNTVRLDADEFVTGISGRCGDNIDSLRVHTNRRTSQLFGGGGGNREYRSEVPPGNQGVGFAGRAGEYLDAIGLVYAPRYVARRGYFPRGRIGPSQIVQTPLAGGRGGSPFADREAPPGGRIVEVRVRAGERVDSVQIIYQLENGSFREGPRHGGPGGRDNVFRLDRDEVIIGIAGRYGDTVDSLRIITNKRTSPVYGGGGGNRDYRIDVPPNAMVAGFAGRAGDLLDAVGLTYF